MENRRIKHELGEDIIIENGFARVARSSHRIRLPKKDKDLAYLTGYHLGDGYLEDFHKTFKKRGRGRYEIDYADKDIEQIELINKILNEKFSFNLRIYKVPNKNLWIGRGACKVLHWFLNKKMEIPYGNRTIITIPSWIKKESSFLSNFLSGFFDAEADVGKISNGSFNGKKYYKIRIQLTQKDKNILLEIKDILEKNYRLKSYIYGKWKQNAFILKLDSKKSINTFKEKINFRNPTKRGKLNKLISEFY